MKLNNNGFSIAESLVAFGIMSIVSLAITVSIVDSRRAIANLELKLEQVGFETSLRQSVFSKNSKCISSFAGVTLLPATLVVGASIQMDPALIQFKAGTLASANFKYFNNLQNGDVIFNVTAVPTANSAVGKIVFSTVNKTTIGPQLVVKPFEIDFEVTVDALGVIISCPAAAVSGTIDINDCQTVTAIHNQVPQNVWRDAVCPVGFKMMNGTGYPDGVQDENIAPRLSILEDMVRVRPHQDSWVTTLKCCRKYP